MSNAPAGPGWWVASDGQWYPPELAPPGIGRILTADQARSLYAAGDRASDVMAAVGPPPTIPASAGPAAPRCPRCGVDLRGDDRYCAGCGAPVDATGARIPAPPAIPGGPSVPSAPVMAGIPTSPLGGPPPTGWTASPPAGEMLGGPSDGRRGGPYPSGVGEPVDRRSGIPLASLGSRLAAAVIDGGLIVALYLVVAVAFAIADGLGIVMFLAWLAVAVAVPVVGEGGVLGQTPGKCLIGIKVLGPVPGPIGYGRALLRWFGRAFVDSPFVLCWFPLGLLWALWDGERRCWHDMMADTRVVIAPAGHERSLAFWWRHSKPGR
jgi:uncharacterized RDD family membrane protein YckC